MCRMEAVHLAMQQSTNSLSHLIVGPNGFVTRRKSDAPPLLKSLRAIPLDK